MKSAQSFTALAAFATFLFTATGCLGDESPAKPEALEKAPKPSTENKTKPDKDKKVETITLGAGCFWCIEAVLLRIKGVESVVSGYSNGDVKNPTYRQVCTGTTGHAEVVKVTFDPQVLPLEQLLDIFFDPALHDPTTLNRQGNDVGTQYRSGIYYHNEEQKQAAEAAKKKWELSGTYRNPIVTEIEKAGTFYEAEDYHQNYFNLNPNQGYCRAVILPKLKKLGLLKP